MSGLEVQAITKAFQPDESVLSGVSFSQQKGEIVAVLGPSGCGKSTLLSIIAGLLEPDRGAVLWNGEDLREVPPHKRGFGLMFQDYALFPHMRVRENVAFGLRMQGASRAEMDKRVAETLEMVGLPGFGDRDVHQLSGGEQQRVELARAIAPNPSLLMLDEPLGSLDRALREQLLEDLRQIVRSANQTTLYVTHDQDEAFSLADRLVVMRAGQVMQTGTPQAIYRRPACAFVARFIGLTNLVPGDAQGGKVETPLGKFPLTEPADGPVQVLVRPDAARWVDAVEALTGIVEEVTFQGETSRVRLTAAQGIELHFDLPSTAALPTVGEAIPFLLNRETAVQSFPAGE